jgi:hypothetical protein
MPANAETTKEPRVAQCDGAARLTPILFLTLLHLCRMLAACVMAGDLMGLGPAGLRGDVSTLPTSCWTPTAPEPYQ